MPLRSAQACWSLFYRHVPRVESVENPGVLFKHLINQSQLTLREGDMWFCNPFSILGHQLLGEKTRHVRNLPDEAEKIHPGKKRNSKTTQHQTDMDSIVSISIPVLCLGEQMYNTGRD